MATRPVRPVKRMYEMSEEEQLQAAMQASMSDASGAAAIDVEDEIIYVDDDSECDTGDAPIPVDRKPQAEKEEEVVAAAVLPTLNEALLDFALPEEPAAGGSRIQLRLPDGKRVVRTFAASDLVRAIYAYVAVRVKDISYESLCRTPFWSLTHSWTSQNAAK
jgi:hypothetical protein